MAGKIVHIISHSHWDREWYLPFEQHRMRLVQLFEDLIMLFDTDPSFKSFHLDGQTVLLEDYLQIRPDRKEKITSLIKEKKLVIGPWYILQDEFLVSSEANVRNLLIGFADTASYGVEPSKLGYFPDSFGNMGQAPQLLRQAGIDYAVFGRGVKPTGASNMVSDTHAYESPYSEMYWQAPDGSTVIGILFANWYHNGMEIPKDKDEASAYWEERIKVVEKYASTGQLLFMNGCDHQPVQLDLSAAIKTAREQLPGYTFEHSSFEQYTEALREELPDNLSTVNGELRSQHTDGWGTLVNTASARVYIKQENQRCQTLLEKVAEPLSAIAATVGDRSDARPLFTYAWKTLLQNHPHDSICGCSVDEVHREMMTRYAKAQQVGEELSAQMVSRISSRIDTSSFGRESHQVFPFTVFNTTGHSRSGVVEIELEVAREALDYSRQNEILDRLAQVHVDQGEIRDEAGNRVAFSFEDLGIVFGYELPGHRFRQPYYARKVRLSLFVSHIAAMGYATYAWYSGAAAAHSKPLSKDPAAIIATGRSLENVYLRIEIAYDGAIDMLDKRNGRRYAGLGIYENVGDIGSEYTFRSPEGEAPLTTSGLNAEVKLLQTDDNYAVLEIQREWLLPVSAEVGFADELNRHVPITERQSRRSEAVAPALLRTYVRLERDTPEVQIRTVFDNRHKDHRLRMLFPTDTRSAVLDADSVFEVAQRPIEPATEWSNPSNCQHQQAFVAVGDGEGGLTIANKGLNEYEVLRDGRNTIALTLIRAVAELGDWGVFLTPEAQCLGEHVLECSILPHFSAEENLDTYVRAYQAQVPWRTAQLPVQSGTLPAASSFLDWSGMGLALTAFKRAEDGRGVIARWYNMTSETQELRAGAEPGNSRYFRSNILERDGQELVPEGNGYCLLVKPHEIVTLRICEAAE